MSRAWRDEGTLAAARAGLAAVYGDAAVAARFGADSVEAWLAGRETGEPAPNIEATDATSLLLRLFVCGRAVADGWVRELLAAAAVRDAAVGGLLPALERLGLVAPCGDGWLGAPLAMLPYGGAWVVTDHQHFQRGADSVFFPDASSVRLARCLPPFVAELDGGGVGGAGATGDSAQARAARRAHLDLGSGCGVAALVSARMGRAAHVQDVNPRATQLAVRGFALSGLPGPRVHHAAFDAVRGRFQLVTFNLPLPPLSDADALARIPVHTLATRGDLLDRVLDGLPGRLTDGGLAVLHSQLPNDLGAFEASLRERGRRDGLDAAVLHDDTLPRHGVIAVRRGGRGRVARLELGTLEWRWPLLRAALQT